MFPLLSQATFKKDSSTNEIYFMKKIVGDTNLTREQLNT
jgi:hypothetical protein